MIKSYEKFIIEIKEGLIVSHDSKKSAELISFDLSKWRIKNQVGAKSKFEIIIIIKNSNLDIDLLKSLIMNYSNLYGYYPSNFKLKFRDNNEENFKWHEIEDKKNLDKIKLSDTIFIKFESKYEDGIYTNNVICPDYVYHLTKSKFLPNILKKGLYPKSKNKKSDHPERIYVFVDENNYNNLLTLLKRIDNDLYALLEIDCREDNLMLHTDPNFYGGYFTYDNIHPSYIKIIKNNL